MAKTNKIVKVIVAMTHNDEPIILDNNNDFDITVLDSIFLLDEPFTNSEIIPKKVGLYELECEMWHDDGSPFIGFENVESDLSFNILKVKELYKI